MHQCLSWSAGKILCDNKPLTINSTFATNLTFNTLIVCFSVCWWRNSFHSELLILNFLLLDISAQVFARTNSHGVCEYEWWFQFQLLNVSLSPRFLLNFCVMPEGPCQQDAASNISNLSGKHTSLACTPLIIRALVTKTFHLLLHAFRYLLLTSPSPIPKSQIQSSPV